MHRLSSLEGVFFKFRPYFKHMEGKLFIQHSSILRQISYLHDEAKMHAKKFASPFFFKFSVECVYKSGLPQKIVSFFCQFCTSIKTLFLFKLRFLNVSCVIWKQEILPVGVSRSFCTYNLLARLLQNSASLLFNFDPKHHSTNFDFVQFDP